jgi:hypothetical protein
MVSPAHLNNRRNQSNGQQHEVTIDDTLTENLQLVIMSVLGVTDRMKVNSFVRRMHASDTAAIREWLRDNSPGIDATINLNCQECGQEFQMELPITASFFVSTQKSKRD